MAAGSLETYWRIGQNDWQTGTDVVVGPTQRRDKYGGVRTVTFYSVDKAGNAEAEQSVQVKIDLDPPMTGDDSGWAHYDAEGTPVPPPVVSGDTTVTLLPWDGLSGVATTYYRLDGAMPFVSGTSVFIAAGAAPQLHRIDYYSVDNIGNVESLRFTLIEVLPTDAPVLSGLRATQLRDAHVARSAARHHGLLRKRR